MTEVVRVTGRPPNFDQILISFKLSNFQTFKRGCYRTNENTFRLLVISCIPEILRQMLLTPGALKIALSSSRN